MSLSYKDNNQNFTPVMAHRGSTSVNIPDLTSVARIELKQGFGYTIFNTGSDSVSFMTAPKGETPTNFIILGAGQRYSFGVTHQTTPDIDLVFDAGGSASLLEY